MNKYLTIAILFLLTGIAVISSIIQVKESEIVIVSQFGRPNSVISSAGPALKWPDPIETTVRLDKRLQTLSLPSTEYGTRDRRNVVMGAYLVWRIEDPIHFLTSARSIEVAQLRLETLANGEIGSEIASVPISGIFSADATDNQIDALFERVTESVTTKAMRELGIEVVSVAPYQFGYPIQNLQAIYERMASEWDRLARQYRAEGMETASKIQAETELEIREMRAKAYRDDQHLLGEAESQAAELFTDVFESNPELYRLIRSMEAYQSMFGEGSRIVLPADLEMFEPLFNRPSGGTDEPAS
ncbi:protease modulator HflC [Photobacterium sp. DNB23_23_1]|uniref:Protein HflC n=1 Tax=Photobacterium pectinilyticum TaxID=2906793 RepID=A0ABT1MXV2_9GAMM|nr:protease modulator HflC [Photobacterium sp. ZSDE20]MCQ1057320.1 protease modulator HflC [Photobacterium sp. ZSDE20]MDD1821779.1 protease modulator HflC [Photobacterium sp. ZSDE20]